MRSLLVIATAATLSLTGAAFAQSTPGATSPGMSDEGRAAAPDAGPADTGGAIKQAPAVNGSSQSGAGHLGANGSMNGDANGNHMSGGNGQ